MPNGVALVEIGNGKWETGNASERKRLLFLGRIHPKKGLVGLIRAWAKLKSERGGTNWGEWQFVIAGWDQGGHEGELRALCGELGLKVCSFQGSVFSREEADVVFHGPAFGEEKEVLLRSASAFILPSLSEGLPM